MARIYFSMAGEGRGHATRVRSTVEQLRGRHDIVLFAPDDAFDLLSQTYAGTRVRVHRIPGPRFYYRRDNNLDYPRTIAGGLRYLRRLPGIQRRLEEYMTRHPPDLVVADFEPALPRTARRMGVPFISVNHQHFLPACELSDLPGWIRRHVFYMRYVVLAYHRGQRRTIVSTFFFPPVRRGWEHVELVGTLLRPELLDARPTRGGHVLAYIRKHEAPEIIDALRNCGRPVFVYGLGERPATGDLVYMPVNEKTFMEHLVSCEALVCTAGNQLIGEALFLGKPVYALPELNNWEQYINAFYVSKAGCGEYSDYNRITPMKLKTFLGRADEYRGNMDREKLNGIPRVVEAIEEELAKLGVT